MRKTTSYPVLSAARSVVPVAHLARSVARFTPFVAHCIPRRTVRRWPRSARRGLGLFDAILAIGVLSFMLLWGGQIVGNWARDRVVAGEARTVADLARAGRLLVEGDVTHARRSHPVGAAPLEIDLSDLEGAGLRASTLGPRTPGRRTLSLHLWRPSTNDLVVIAKAHGDRPLSRLPGAETGVSGVGLLLDLDGTPGLQGGETRLLGPGVDFDMGPVNTVDPGFATVNDLFALDYVALDAPCRNYLYRVTVALDCDGDGTVDADANTMATSLDMGGNDLTGVGTIMVPSATIGTLEGATEVTGGLTVDGEMSVTGVTEMRDLTVNAGMTATSVEVTDTLTAKDLTATGDITGANLTFDGEVNMTVAGDARLNDVDVDTLNVLTDGTLDVRRLLSEEGNFDQIVADDVTVTNCTGCTP